MRIARCFYGQPRFVNNQDVPRSYSEEFNNRNFEYDSFGHVWFSPGLVYNSTSWTQQHEPYQSDNHTVGKLINYYGFKKLLVENPPEARQFLRKEVREYYQGITGGSFPYSEFRENNILSLLYSMQSVGRMVDYDYDFYVLCRYDTIVANIPDFTALDRDGLYLTNVGSWGAAIMVFSSKFLYWIQSIHDLCQAKTYNMSMFIPEEFQQNSFHEMCPGKPFINSPVSATIVRND